MSPRLGAITDRIPYASSTQTAISRDEPQPKFSATTRILAPRYGAWFRTNSGFSEPSALKRTSWKRKPAYPGAPLGLQQEARGNDAVGVDVGQIERRRDRREPGEGLH